MINHHYSRGMIKKVSVTILIKGAYRIVRLHQLFCTRDGSYIMYLHFYQVIIRKEYSFWNHLNTKQLTLHMNCIFKTIAKKNSVCFKVSD